MTGPTFFRSLAKARSAGVGLVTAIFLLVVLAALGVALVSITTSQQASAALDLQGARAYQAARAGIEWGVYQQLRNGTCAASTSFAMPSTASLSGFVVTVNCTKYVSDSVQVFRIKATACSLQPANGSCPNPSNSLDYVQRVIEVVI
jgi:MSHA biogenesis protein MshP